MDVVPVVQAQAGYLIPDRETGLWKATNPPAHNHWSSIQNELFKDRFKKLVKMFKWWRRENPTSKRPKGFVLEVLVAHHAPREEKHFGEAFAAMLESIYSSYLLGMKPFISDPAIPANDILAKVTNTQWSDFLEKVRIHAKHARGAQEVADEEDATGLWQKVFGPRFKSSPSMAKASSLSQYASAAPPAGGYVFPDTMAAPKKPRGFA